MSSVLVSTGDEGVTLTAQAASRLLERGDGDAALLYLATSKRGGMSHGKPGGCEYLRR